MAKTPIYNFGYLVPNQDLSENLDLDELRFKAIDSQVYSLYQIFKNGISTNTTDNISWEVNTYSNTNKLTKVSISTGAGNVSWKAAETSASKDVILPVLPSGVTEARIWLYAIENTNTPVTKDVDFIASLTEINDPINYVSLGGVIVDVTNSQISVFTEGRQYITIFSSIAELIKNHKHVGGSSNPAPIDLTNHVTGTLTGEYISNIDASKISTMQERLSQGYHLQKKHKVQSTADLLEIQQTLSKELEDVLHIDEAIETYTKKVAAAEKDLITSAANLSELRKKQAAPFAKQVNHLLHQVGMPNAQLKVQLDTVPFNQFGIDKIDFLFDANNTQKFEPIKKVASGGELSRLMLCIKSLVGKSIDLPTMIFDEIDSGISGEPAKQVGLLLQELGQARQVLCITHQPQIAAKGQAHLYVYKNKEGNTTHTHVRALEPAERVIHIARMIGGDPPSKAAIEHANELLA
jgi:predicted nuclease of predicted toxin-antitoxin system